MPWDLAYQGAQGKEVRRQHGADFGGSRPPKRRNTCQKSQEKNPHAKQSNSMAKLQLFLPKFWLLLAAAALRCHPSCPTPCQRSSANLLCHQPATSSLLNEPPGTGGSKPLAPPWLQSIVFVQHEE